METTSRATAPIEGTSIIRWMPWILRATWIATGVLGASAIDAAVGDRSEHVRTTVLAGTAAGWVLGVASMAVPAVISLTAVRVIAPLAVVTAVAALIAGAPTIDGMAFVVAALVTAIVAASAETGHAFVQASAYGDEQRFPLRPPLGYGIVTALSWLAWAGTVLGGPLLLAAGIWIPGATLTVLAAAATIVLTPRWHHLSRRWLVLVPAGVVLHDPVVLAETLMLKRSEVAALRLAPADSDALDLTGPTPGHAIEVTSRSSVTALFAPTPAQPRGRAVHLTSYLAAPSRPGRALVAARARRLPVG